MKILIVAPFVSLPGEPQSNRFLYLAQMWAKKNSVTLVTSRFSHFLKVQRDRENKRFHGLPFELVLLDELGYQENVSLMRIISHSRFVSGFRKWITREAKNWAYDVVYSAYPLIATNLILADFKDRLGFTLLLDVQDVWPEAISSAFPIVGRFEKLLLPLTRSANRAYSSSDGLVTVSKTYLDRARRNCPQKPGIVVYIGAEKERVDSVFAADLPSGPFRLLYIGTLSHSYDIRTVVKGVNLLRLRYPELELQILGDGPHRKDIQSQAGEGVIFHGIVSYNRMLEIAKSCDLAINPIVNSALQSVTNKLSDYFMLGLPILSSQQNPEVVELVKKAGGIQYEAGNINSFYEGVERFIGIENKVDIRLRTRAIGVDLFDRAVSYPRITEFLYSIANRKGSPH